MNRLHPVLLVAAAVVILLGLTFAASRGDGPGLFAPSRSAAASSDTLAQLLQTQNEILRRLDRLESARPGRGGTAAMAANARDASGNGNGQGGMSAAEIAANQAAAMRTRENAFVNEPLSAAWASSSEKKIDKALSAAALTKEGATAPKSVESTCHSQTCRISMSFDDGMQADFTKIVFLEQIGEALPQAEIFQQANPDGSIRYVVYARRSDAGTERR